MPLTSIGRSSLVMNLPRSYYRTRLAEGADKVFGS